MKSKAYDEVDWDKLDKRKFFVVGAGLFSGVTTMLYPISVIKTRQMASSTVASGFKGVTETSRRIWHADGVRGFYRGFSTVVLGTMPSRVVYLTTLEYTKSITSKALQPFDLSEATTSGASNFVGAGLASLCTQALMVPVDVVSQRQMMHGAPPEPPVPHAPAPPSTTSTKRFTTAAVLHPGAPSSHPAVPPSASPAARLMPSPRHISGLQMAHVILRQEGVRGMYRGFGASLMLYAPSSAIWWGCYGAYQKLIWSSPLLQLAPRAASSSSSSSSSSSTAAQQAQQQEQQQEQQQAPAMHNPGQVVAVQTLAAVLAGMTSSMLTNPLDLIKTRMQVAEALPGATPRFRQVLQEVLQREGARGLFRGVVPRGINSVLWGTTMVSVYEFLKRICAIPEAQLPAAASS